MFAFFPCTRNLHMPSRRQLAREGFCLPYPTCSFLDLCRIFPSQKDGKLRCVRRWLWALVGVNSQQWRGLCMSLPLRFPCCLFWVNQSLNGKSMTGKIKHKDEISKLKTVLSWEAQVKRMEDQKVNSQSTKVLSRWKRKTVFFWKWAGLVGLFVFSPYSFWSLSESCFYFGFFCVIRIHFTF